MATPSEKSPEMERQLDNLSMSMYGRKRTESIRNDICVPCGGEAIHFVDDLSRREYTISGQCQKCQNEVFGGFDL